GCQPGGSAVDPVEVSPDPAGRAKAVAAHRLAQDVDDPEPRRLAIPDDVPVRPVLPPPATQPAPAEIELELLDPMDELARIDQRLAREDLRPGERPELERLRRRVATAIRPNTIRLGLDEVIRRTLQNNYGIQFQSYNPAID